MKQSALSGHSPSLLIVAGLALAALVLTVPTPALGAPTCTDPARTLFVSGSAACHVYDQDPASCGVAFAVTQSTGQAVSCFYTTSPAASCQGCGPTNQAAGLCVNACAGPAVPATTSSASALFAIALAGLGITRLRRGRSIVAWGMACAVFGQVRTARADEVTLLPAKDTTIYERDATLGNGRGQHLFAGLNGARSPRRALVAFEVTRSVPTGATITGAALSLTLTRAQATAATVRVHRVLNLWGEGDSAAAGEEGGGAPATEGDATWSHRLWPGTEWDEPGGDFVAAESASLELLELGRYTWTSPELADDVRRFLDQPDANHGWILEGDGQAKRFESREAGVGAAPALLVTFDPPAQETGACCFADGTCGVSLAPGTTCDGSYAGTGTSCTPGICPEPTAACCMPDATATCEVRRRSDCAGGTWRASSANCEPNPCPVVLTPFVDPLPLPVVAVPEHDHEGTRAHYRLSMVEVEQQLHRDLPPTKVWGYHDGVSGGYPGPTIEARSGEPVEVTWVNDLRDGDGNLLEHHALPVDHCVHGAQDDLPRTVVHLHGGHVPAEYDGYPESTLLPGEQTIYEYPNAQRAATLWYHDHALGITRLNVMMGLAGFYLLRDDEEAELGLPSGKYEVPLAIQDRSFNPDGSLKYPETWQQSFFGDTIVVNGKVNPYLEVDRGLYRFRLLNGSTSRTYSLFLSDGAGFLQLGSDGGLLEESIAIHEITIAPGERADIVMDFRYASDKVLKNRALSPFPGGGSGPDLTEVLKFIVKDAPGHQAPVPLRQSSIPKLDEADAVISRDLVLQPGGEGHCGDTMWLVNGKEWDEITERPHLGTTEVWRFINRSGVMHPMHLHSLFFQVLDRQPFKLENDEIVPKGEPLRPPRGESGWKDTVQVGPLEIVRVIARFEDYVGRFSYHCHLIEHEDHGMMRQFETFSDCGDGALAIGQEACDDGNTRNGDGCDASCAIETDEAPSSAGSAGEAPTDGARGGSGGSSSRGTGGSEAALAGEAGEGAAAGATSKPSRTPAPQRDTGCSTLPVGAARDDGGPLSVALGFATLLGLARRRHRGEALR